MELPENMTDRETRRPAPNPYLFKGVLDGALYIFVYFALPLYSVYEGFRHDDGSILFTALSCCVCLVYDCYSRYERGCGSDKKRKLYVIGGVNFGLMIYTFLSIQFYMEEGSLSCVWIYLLLLLAPVLGLADLLKMADDDIHAKE